MKLLSKNDARSKAKLEQDQVINETSRLREYAKQYRQLINSGNFEDKKAKEVKDFEQFCKDIQTKKAKLLEELSSIQIEIENKKDVYYGFIAKQDELDERLYNIVERENKLDLREAFVKSLEKKQHDLSKL